MIERAEWRIRREGARTPLGLFFGQDRPRGIPVGWLVFACSLLYMLVRSFSEALLVRWLADLLNVVAGFAALTLFAVLVGKDRRAPLAPDPAPDATFGGRIALSRSFQPLGRDEGVFAFSEGWLVYEGRHTSFSLRPADVRKSIRFDDPLSWKLTLDEGQSLEIVVNGTGANGPGEAFGAAFDAWLGQPSPAGLSRLPPLAPYRRAKLGLAAALHALGPTIFGIVAGLAIKEAVLGTLKAAHWSILGGATLIAVVFSVLARLVLWERGRRR